MSNSHDSIPLYVATGYNEHVSAKEDKHHAVAQGFCCSAEAHGEMGNAAAQGGINSATAYGYRGHAVAQGSHSTAVTYGDGGHAAALCLRGRAEVNGQGTIAAALGPFCRARASTGNWIVCAEYVYFADTWHVADIQAAKIDGKKLKPDTWYTLRDGTFVEDDIK